MLMTELYHQSDFSITTKNTNIAAKIVIKQLQFFLQTF